MRFTAFGIPVTVDPFFLLGLFLVWSWAGSDRAGLFAALFVGVFTLVHELGHALTARRFGATATITLNLLVGWASYTAPRPLTRRQRNLVSLAGPLTQLVLALPVLYLAFSRLPAPRSADAAVALTGGDSLSVDVWTGAVWAGVIIGLLNLLPLWPLDGGHVVDSFLTGGLGERRGRRVMLISTLVAVGVVAALGFSVSSLTSPYNGLEREVLRAKLAPFSPLLGTSHGFFGALWEQVRTFPGRILDFPILLVVFCGLNSFLALQRLPRHDRVATWLDVEAAPGAAVTGPGVPADVVRAERAGWLDGAAVAYPAGWVPSPWLAAHLALAAGQPELARRALEGVVTPGRPRWHLPEPADLPGLGPLVALLPRPLPLGDPERSLTLLRVLAAHGSAEQVATYAATLYGARHQAEVLYLAAAGLARTGHGDEAMAWLRRAVQDRPDEHRLATDRGLWPLHRRPDYQQLLADVRAMLRR